MPLRSSSRKSLAGVPGLLGLRSMASQEMFTSRSGASSAGVDTQDLQCTLRPSLVQRHCAGLFRTKLRWASRDSSQRSRHNSCFFVGEEIRVGGARCARRVTEADVELLHVQRDGIAREVPHQLGERVHVAGHDLGRGLAGVVELLGGHRFALAHQSEVNALSEHVLLRHHHDLAVTGELDIDLRTARVQHRSGQNKYLHRRHLMSGAFPDGECALMPPERGFFLHSTITDFIVTGSSFPLCRVRISSPRGSSRSCAL